MAKPFVRDPALLLFLQRAYLRTRVPAVALDPDTWQDVTFVYVPVRWSKANKAYFESIAPGIKVDHVVQRKDRSLRLRLPYHGPIGRNQADALVKHLRDSKVEASYDTVSSGRAHPKLF